jgi:hypothetical protein
MFLALRARLAAVRGEAEDAPPDALPEVAAVLPEVAAAPGEVAAVPAEVAAAPAELAAAPADSTAAAAINPQAASPDLPGPALPRDSAAPRSDEAAVAQHVAAPATAGGAPDQSAAADQPAKGPGGPQPSGPPVSDTSTQNARAPNRRRVPPRHARRPLFRAGLGFATRSLMLPRWNIISQGRSVVRSPPRPPRLFCYTARAGPPALLRRAEPGAPGRKACTGPPRGGPATPIPAA